MLFFSFSAVFLETEEVEAEDAPFFPALFDLFVVTVGVDKEAFVVFGGDRCESHLESHDIFEPAISISASFAFTELGIPGCIKLPDGTLAFFELFLETMEVLLAILNGAMRIVKIGLSHFNNCGPSAFWSSACFGPFMRAVGMASLFRRTVFFQLRN